MSPLTSCFSLSNKSFPIINMVNTPNDYLIYRDTKSLFIESRHSLYSSDCLFSGFNRYMLSVCCNTWCNGFSSVHSSTMDFKNQKALHCRHWPIRIKHRAVSPRPFVTRTFFSTKALSTDLFMIICILTETIYLIMIIIIHFKQFFSYLVLFKVMYKIE